MVHSNCPVCSLFQLSKTCQFDISVYISFKGSDLVVCGIVL